MQRAHTVQPSELMSEAWRLEHPTVGKTINYSSRLEGFATQHWSQSRHKAVREEDVEAAGEEPLLGRSGPEHPKSILGLPMLEPSSWLAELVTMLTLLTDCTYTVFWVPCSVAFGTNPAKWSITSALDLLAGAIFTVNILQTLQTGIIVRYNLQRKIVMDGWIVASYYLKEGSMVADVLSTLPSIVQALSLIGLFGYPDAAVLRTLIVLRWLRVARLLLFLRGHLTTGLLGRLGRRLTAWRLPLTTYLLADILYCGFALTNFLGMLWLFCAQCEGLDNSWLADVGGEDLTSSSMLDIYVASVLFATSTMSTVGYGDIRARTTPERAVSMFIMLIGVLFFGFVISALGRLLEVSSPEARRAVLFRDKINKVDAWMSYRQLPGKLRTDIIGFYANSWAPQSEIHEAKLYEELPAVLRGQVATHLLHDILESTGWWEALPESERWRLAAIMHPQQLLPGHDLTQEGEPAACLWLLQEGELLAIKHAVQWERLQAPALVGEEALLQGEGKEAPVRPCAYRAVGGCTLWALVVSELQPLLRTFPALRDRLTSVINTQHSPRVRHSLDLAAFDRSRLPAQSSPGAAAHPGRGQPGDTTRAGQPEESASDSDSV